MIIVKFKVHDAGCIWSLGCNCFLMDIIPWVYECTNFKTKRYISWIRDGRHWEGSEMFEIRRFEKRQKTLVNTRHPVFLDLLSYLWNLRLHCYIIQTSLFGGHMAISSLTVSFQFHPCFFSSWGCWKSHNPLTRRFFLVEKRFGIWECDSWSIFWTCFLTPFWWLWMKIWPCHVKPQARRCF